MHITRRTLLSSVAVGGGAVALAGCGTSLATLTAQWNSAVTAIQAAVAKYAGYIPAVESVAAEAAALFGPQYTAIVAVGSAALNQVVAVLTKVVSDLSPPASAKLRSRLRASSPSAPTSIGTTPEGVAVVGFRV